VLSSLLLGLYDRWCNYGKLTIVTTNLTMTTGGRVPGVLDVLGERIYSRFNEMFEFVRFNGARDYRRFRPSERITCSNLPER
jgi:DNA replication protein DnaC